MSCRDVPAGDRTALGDGRPEGVPVGVRGARGDRDETGDATGEDVGDEEDDEPAVGVGGMGEGDSKGSSRTQPAFPTGTPATPSA